VKSVWVIFGSAALIGLSGAMMPGPLLTACIGYTLDRGFWSGGPLLVAGHALLELTLVVLVLAGLGPWLSRPRVAAGIGLVGGGVLVWMGYGMAAFAASGAAQLSVAQPTQLFWSNPVAAGVLVSLANPYWSLWWATIGLKYLSLSREAGRGGVAAFFLGHTLSDVGWYLLVAGGVALGRAAISDLVYRRILGACGVVLAGFGLYFLVGAIARLVRPALPPPEGFTPSALPPEGFIPSGGYSEDSPAYPPEGVKPSGGIGMKPSGGKTTKEDTQCGS
jgi:threonine/homoserine/homoserine lactone efflux protein